MIISATELYVKNIFTLLPALKISRAIIAEMQRSPGMLEVKASPKGVLLLRTVSAWESEEAMLQFVRSGTHMEAMKRTSEFARATRVARWEADSMPNKATVAAQLAQAKMVDWKR